MRMFLFTILLAGTVTAAILWNRYFLFPLEEPAAAEERQVPTDRVEVVIGLPPGATVPRRHPGRPPRRKAPSRPRPASPRVAPQSPAPSPSIPPVRRTAILRRGETVYGLARRLLGDGSRYREILELNGLTEAQARNLATGTRLELPSD